MNDPVAFEDDQLGASRTTGGNREFASLSDALRIRRLPIENHEVIRRIVEAAGASTFLDRGGYLKATAPDAVLHIHFGYTNGIPTEAAAESIRASLATSAVEVYKSARSWGITHPINSIRGGGGAARGAHRDYGTCSGCFTTIAANGTCGCD